VEKKKEKALEKTKEKGKDKKKTNDMALVSSSSIVDQTSQYQSGT